MASNNPTTAVDLAAMTEEERDRALETLENEEADASANEDNNSDTDDEDEYTDDDDVDDDNDDDDDDDDAPAWSYTLKDPTTNLSRHTFPIGVDEDRWQSNTITIREQAMLWFINVITDKPQWWTKVNDTEIVAKWKAELDGFVQKGGEPFQAGFTDKMFEFCIKELQDKAPLYEATAKNGSGGIISVIDTAAAVFKADGRVPGELVQKLRDAAKLFEDVPEDEKDWHPGSNEQVLDLVHPSLWPLVYGTSLQLKKEIGVTEALKYIASGEIVPVPTAASLGLTEVEVSRLWSKRFQWLPADVSFGPDGKGTAKITSYINNAHPVQHKALYPVIEQLIDLSLPMWAAAYERVMTWTATYPSYTEKLPLRKRIQCNTSNRVCGVQEYCNPDGAGWCNSYRMPPSETPEGITDDDDEYYELAQNWYSRTHPVSQPEAPDYVFGGVRAYQTEGPWFPEARRRPVGPLSAEDTKKEKREKDAAIKAVRTGQPELNDKSPEEITAIHKKFEEDLVAKHTEAVAAAVKEEGKDHRLQVIVKLANIHLTPEKPSYAGGSWHFEGQLNEHICATSLYYYDCTNVTESRLAFRTVADAESYTEGEYEYEQGDHEPFEKIYGVVPDDENPTAQRLGDVVTKEDRLLVFPNVLQHQVQPFELADKTKPGHRKIVALFLVDPNVRVPSTATVPPQQFHWREASAVDTRLPPEISTMVYEHVDVPYKLEKAKELRAELIEERKAIEETVGSVVASKTWSFCEH